MQIIDNSVHQRVYTISELTADIKSLLEENFPFIWLSGEISNFRVPVSGHFYFTLKDQKAQVSAVMFRGQNRNLRFVPEDGMSVTGLGRISVYEPRGSYQIILEYLEPEGVGALQVSFEQMKARLSAEGLFDDRHKKPLPFLPEKISVITSPTGAVVHDILRVISRRFPNCHVEIIPVRVQGDEAEGEIVSALKLLSTRDDADVAILARGGGSLEDLHAFNSEGVTRAIFDSPIPIVSAVGHETDFTIADFVADLRAPTPSVAAELVVPLKQDLQEACSGLSNRLIRQFHRYLDQHRSRVSELSERLTDPKKRIQDMRLMADDLTARLIRVFRNDMRQRREQLSWRVNQLKALSPTAILERGYSITRTVPGSVVLMDSHRVSKGQQLEVMLAKGGLICRVEGKTEDGQTDKTDI
ncbi:MAG: exodeoxyribonuclease VII large subunit [Desulfobacteraceae bacterium 4572_88]|nr:MAG: exodeoxyribonuclease VII large subunit [Desulfobacteraceae bacterium 4572_88]